MPKGGDLKVMTTIFHENDPEMSSHRIGVFEEGLHFIRSRRGSDIKVFGFDAQQLITHRASCKVGFVTGFCEARCDKGGRFF